MLRVAIVGNIASGKSTVEEILKEQGYPVYDADKIARVSQASEMPVCLTHVPMDRILGETEKLMEEHGSFLLV